jgi:hypothetical protein
MTTYLITSANAMYLLLARKPPRLDKLATAASIGCDALTNLADDSDFREAVNKLINTQLASAAPGDLEIRTMKHFSTFLMEEKQVLIENGMIPRLVDELAKQAKQLLPPMQGWGGSVELLYFNIRLASYEACSLADSLKKQLRENESDEASRDKARDRLLRVGYGLGGLTLVVLGSTVASNPLATDTFLALGGALLSHSIAPPKIHDRLTDRQIESGRPRLLPKPKNVSFNASVDVERAEMGPLHTTASVESFNVSVEKVQEFSASVEKSLFGTATLNGESAHTPCPTLSSRTLAASGGGLPAWSEEVSVRPDWRIHRETWEGCIVSCTTAMSCSRN